MVRPTEIFKKLQNKAINILFGSDYYTPTNYLLNTYDLLTVERNSSKLVLPLFYTLYLQRRNSLPIIFQNYFNYTSTERTTRQSNLLKIENVQTEHGKKMIRYAGPVIWNEFNELTN